MLGTAIIFGLKLPLQDVSQISEYRRIVVIVVGRRRLLREYNLDASAISRMLFVGGGVSLTIILRGLLLVVSSLSVDLSTFAGGFALGSFFLVLAQALAILWFSFQGFELKFTARK